VLREIDRLRLDVEMRNIHETPQHRKDLVAARGRSTVPVLRITSAENDRWMPESAEIASWLRREYGSRSASR
jgi:hypothetical protein